MGERDRAEHYERHQGDTSDWGEPLPEQPRRRLASMISVRLAPDEIAKIREAAKRDGLTVSAFLRDAALKAASPEEPPSSSPAAAYQLIELSHVKIEELSPRSQPDSESFGVSGPPVPA